MNARAFATVDATIAQTLRDLAADCLVIAVELEKIADRLARKGI